MLRFDGTGKADSIDGLIKKAGKQKLEVAELTILEEAFRNHEPWPSCLGRTVSLPFPEGEHKRIAVKVIDPHGNEVLRVHRLDGKY